MITTATPFWNLPLAATERAGEAVYELTRLESLHDSSGVILALVVVLMLVLGYSWLMYRREARTVSAAKAMGLALLRTIAVMALVVFFLGLEKRRSSQVTEPSRVAVLVDTSLSMELPASDATSSDPTSRATSAQQMLAVSPLVSDLVKQHDVDIVAFGESTRPITYLPQKTIDDTEQRRQEDVASAKDDPLNAERLSESLQPTGHETRLGDAIAATLERYRGLPLAGIVLLSDGGQNRGLELASAAQAAADAKVTIHSVGFGPLVAPPNIAVGELIAPERAYPGDNLSLQAIVHAQDVAGQQLELQLARRPASDEGSDVPASAWESVASQTLRIAQPDVLETVRFETSPAEEGTYIYEIRALPLSRESRVDDNAQQAEVTVIDRKTRVLLYAGGPMRDYRFVRNQLRRDDSFIVDVFLATGGPGISQDANELLNEFPTSAEQLSQYDAIVAFDPDWSKLSADQVRWLEQWVARQAGGMVVVPGRVNTPRWGIDAQMRTIRGLYPVNMPDQLLDLRGQEGERTTPRPLEFTREGNEAEFLWLSDAADESVEAWQEFSGVYGAFEHDGPKPGATIYAHLAGATEDARGPAYLVGQYYGAGSVFFIGSGEMWRLRRLDIDYYDRLWTALLRHVSQGRLLQGSPRGKLLISQDRYDVGATVAVRAVMSDQQMEPLVADALELSIDLPEGQTQKLNLVADDSRPGNFAGEFRVVVPGPYRLTLPVPDSSEQLTRRLQVSAPQLEVGQITRNADALRSVSDPTGGHYYESPSIASSGNDRLPAIADAIASQARTKRVLGAIDERFARTQSFVLLAVVAGALCLEWIIRRLNYLA